MLSSTIGICLNCLLAVSSAGDGLGAQGRLDGFNGEIEGREGHSGYANNGNRRERCSRVCRMSHSP